MLDKQLGAASLSEESRGEEGMVSGAGSKRSSARQAFEDCPLIEIVHFHECLRGELRSLQANVQTLCSQVRAIQAPPVKNGPSTTRSVAAAAAAAAAVVAVGAVEDNDYDHNDDDIIYNSSSDNNSKEGGGQQGENGENEWKEEEKTLPMGGEAGGSPPLPSSASTTATTIATAAAAAAAAAATAVLVLPREHLKLEVQVQSQFQLLWAVFQSHSTAEDEVIWPALKEKARASGGKLKLVNHEGGGDSGAVPTAATTVAPPASTTAAAAATAATAATATAATTTSAATPAAATAAAAGAASTAAAAAAASTAATSAATAAAASAAVTTTTAATATAAATAAAVAAAAAANSPSPLPLPDNAFHPSITVEEQPSEASHHLDSPNGASASGGARGAGVGTGPSCSHGNPGGEVAGGIGGGDGGAQEGGFEEAMIDEAEYTEEHHEEQRLFEGMQELLTGLRSTRQSLPERKHVMAGLGKKTDEMCRHLMTHLDKEEESALPLIKHYFTGQEMEALVGKIMGKRPTELMQTILAMMIKNLPPEEVVTVMGYMRHAVKDTYFEKWLASGGFQWPTAFAATNKLEHGINGGNRGRGNGNAKGVPHTATRGGVRPSSPFSPPPPSLPPLWTNQSIGAAAFGVPPPTSHPFHACQAHANPAAAAAAAGGFDQRGGGGKRAGEFMGLSDGGGGVVAAAAGGGGAPMQGALSIGNSAA